MLSNEIMTTVSQENDASSSWDDIFTELNDKKIEKEETLDISAEEVLEKIHSRQNIEISLETSINIENKDPIVGCYSCGGHLLTRGKIMICQKCGLEIQGALVSTEETGYNLSGNASNNVNDKGFVSMKIIGPGSYGMNRNLLRTCANYPLYRSANTFKEMKNWNSQSTGGKLPDNIFVEANDMFSSIKEHRYVYRKDVKKGVIGMCIYYRCHLNGISRTPAEIAQIVGVAEKFLSLGDRNLRDLNERGIVKIPEKIDAVNSYVNRYFELLGIPVKYKPFVMDMIEKSEECRLHVLYDSKCNTKCIGTIYMLIDRVPDLKKQIDKEKIETKCSISKTTFIKYYTMLCKYYKKFAHIFIKHHIPMKSEWRVDFKKLIAPKKKVVKKIIKKVSRVPVKKSDDLTLLINSELGVTKSKK